MTRGPFGQQGEPIKRSVSPGGRRPARWPIAAGLLALAALIGGFATAIAGTISMPRSGAGRGHLSPAPRGSPALRAAASRPNIVFVLTDDLSMNLIRFMPQVEALAARGTSFDNYFVSDSLCCPSRSSIFTGNLPHDTGVFTNVGADGGIGAFYARRNEQQTFNVALQQAGYRTAMMGKYLNGYLQGPGRSPVPSTYVPPGWSEWDVAGYGYPEFDYQLNEDGILHYFGHARRDYLTDVLARRGVKFISRSAVSGRSFFLELATFSPHSPYRPAPRDKHKFPGLKAPRPPSFDVLPSDPPSWLAGHPPLTDERIRRINRVFRLRVQAVQAIDRMLGRIEAALAVHHMTRNTYVVFSSDNGLHTGEYRLLPGKLTAFDTDIHVPLIVAGPNVPTNTTTNVMAENIDLAKTFAAIGATSLPSDGHSLLGVLDGETPADWRNAILVEHHGPDLDSSDPDAQTGPSGNPTSYEAMRTDRYLYVEYRDGERELYDLQRDPFELHNIAAGLAPGQLQRLHAELIGLEHCHTGAECWAAGHVGPGR